MSGRARLRVALSALLAATAAAAAEHVHIVQPGETLWTISQQLVGDPHRWPEIYRANRDQIKDPSTLYPGQQLAIPEFEAGRSTAHVEDAPEVSSPPRP